MAQPFGQGDGGPGECPGLRSFTLPRSADPNAISANYVDGVLEIRVPKREESKPRQIRIKPGNGSTNGSQRTIGSSAGQQAG